MKIPSLSNLETKFPASEISRIATRESWRKEVHRPATSTHKWWAKRLGTVFRGILISAATGTSSDAAEVRNAASNLNGLIVLDPFSGSGITGVEVVKLGGRPICFDINPVATLVERQALQPWNMEDLRELYSEVESKCRAEIEHFYRTEDGRTVLYYFWVALTNCPSCSNEVRLFSTTVFAKHAYPDKFPDAQVVCPECLAVGANRYDFEEHICKNGHSVSHHGAVKGSKATCACGHTFKIIDSLGGNRPRYEMFCKLVLNSDGRKTYEEITQWDRDLYQECTDLLTTMNSNQVFPQGFLAPGHNTNQAIRWGFRQWKDFFNDRQLATLSLLATTIRDIPGLSAEREALVTLFSGTLEFNNLFASYKGEGTGAVRHMFSNHVLRPERTPLEANPWGTPQSSGSFSTLFKSRILRAHDYKQAPSDLVEHGGKIVKVDNISRPVNSILAKDWNEFLQGGELAAYVKTQDSAHTDIPNESVDLVVTDPPYMDNVYYAELADFFQAWLSEMRPFCGYVDNPTTRASGEVQNSDPLEFGKAIEGVWSECYRVLKPGGILAFTFHQARLDGWVNVIDALTMAGFVVSAVQPVKGEMATSVVKSGAKEPSNLDSVVVCRKSPLTSENWPDNYQEALDRAIVRLTDLVNAGISVGSGDVRSVVRGTLLSYFGSPGSTLSQEQIELADEVSEQAAQDWSN